MYTIFKRLVRRVVVPFCACTAVAGDDWSGWAEKEGTINGTTYSVIVVASNPRSSNLFRDQERVHAFASTIDGGGGVASVQFAPSDPKHPLLTGIEPPFWVGHPEGVNKRVRIIYLAELRFQAGSNKETHIRAACDDKDENTVMVITSEACREQGLPPGLPSSCGANVIRVYPFNDDRQPREAYIPLGTINTFPFVVQEEVAAATNRPYFFSLQVTPRSERRKAVVAFAEQYATLNPEVPSRRQGPDMNAEEWQTLLLQSTFTLCPGGHNSETYRMYEALEAGSIPIVSKLDFTNPVYSTNGNSCGTGDFAWNTVAESPFAKEVSVDTWDDLSALLDMLRNKPDDYILQLQESCMAWYAARMTRTYTSLLNFGEGLDMFPQLGPLVDVP